ncbi:MAG: hypothetical protein IPG89_18505 [Bacteroidetes bacterium]|nr:hypothetical protein [Bacteroidota bacterium]
MGILIWFVYEAYSKRKIKFLGGFVFGGITMLFCWLAYFYVFNIDLKELIANLSAHGGGVEEAVP